MTFTDALNVYLDLGLVLNTEPEGSDAWIIAKEQSEYLEDILNAAIKLNH